MMPVSELGHDEPFDPFKSTKQPKEKKLKKDASSKRKLNDTKTSKQKKVPPIISSPADSDAINNCGLLNQPQMQPKSILQSDIFTDSEQQRRQYLKMYVDNSPS